MSNTVPTHDDGSWISGPMRDRPTYPVANLIIEAQRVLREAGLLVSVDPNMLYTASIAGCDLLRSMGVVPITAEPRRTPGGRRGDVR